MSGALCKRWSALGCLVVLVMSVAAVRQARAQTGDDLHKKAVQEGIVNFYGTLAQINAEKILPVLRRGIRVSAAVPNNLSMPSKTSSKLEIRASSRNSSQPIRNGIWRTLKTILSRLAAAESSVAMPILG
jgi:hypothetical protein